MKGVLAGLAMFLLALPHGLALFLGHRLPVRAALRPVRLAARLDRGFLLVRELVPVFAHGSAPLFTAGLHCVAVRAPLFFAHGVDFGAPCFTLGFAFFRGQAVEVLAALLGRHVLERLDRLRGAGCGQRECECKGRKGREGQTNGLHRVLRVRMESGWLPSLSLLITPGAATR